MIHATGAQAAEGGRYPMPLPASLGQRRRRQNQTALALHEVLMVMAALSVLASVGVPIVAQARARSRLTHCLANVQRVNRAVLQYAQDHDHRLPSVAGSPAPGGWWYYKEQVKGYLGLSGPSSPNDTVFACPDDRGYAEGLEKAQPFCRSRKFNFTSYVFNGVDLPGVPNIADWPLSAIRQPERTLLVMEWTAHAPLSWHRSRTGRADTPFYNDAESVVGFVDGHVAFIPIYYDGLTPAFSRNPIPGYAYKYSGD